METAKITKWNTEDKTKLGVCKIALESQGDLVDVLLTIDTLRASGTFSNEREAFLWAYGVKQWLMDRFASFELQESGDFTKFKRVKTVKTKEIEEKLTHVQAIERAIKLYDEFQLGRQSSGASEKLSKSVVDSAIAMLPPELQAQFRAKLAVK